jgi:hypothetical protein
MSDAQLFQIANTTALLSWIVLVLQPKRTALILRFVIPVAMAVLYIWALATVPNNPDGGFGSRRIERYWQDGCTTSPSICSSVAGWSWTRQIVASSTYL